MDGKHGGGLDYLKSVVIDDKLACAMNWSSKWQHVIASYQCEWKTTLADANKLKRFRHLSIAIKLMTTWCLSKNAAKSAGQA